MKKNSFVSLAAALLLTSFSVQRLHAQNTSPFWSLAGNSNADNNAKLGTTNSIPLRLVTNNSVRAFVSTNGSFGIGTTGPQQRFHVEGADNQAIFVNTSGLGSTSGSGQIGYAKDIPTSPDQRLGYFLAGSRGGAQFNYNTAGMAGYSAGAWTVGASHPTYLNFATTPSGSTQRLERMRILANGNVGIGTTAPTSLLHVRRGSAGVTSYGDASVVAEANGNNYLNILAPESSETGLLFGKPSNNVSGGLVYNAAGTPNGFQFRTDGNQTRVIIDKDGNMGINAIPGNYKLVVSHNNAGFDIANRGSGNNWEQYVDDTNDGDLNLYFNGTTNLVGSFDHATGEYSALSDERRKTAIKSMTTMLEKINQLRPATYRFKSDKKGLEHNGFIAQEVMKIFPSMVKHHVDPTRKVDVYTMNYTGFGVLAVKGIQELSGTIEQQQATIAALEDRLEKVEAALTAMSPGKANTDLLNVAGASLSQNTPNPATATTRIVYSLPTGKARAQLLLTDNSGKTVRTIWLTTSGIADIDTNGLSNGVYTYSLVVDGKPIAAKRLAVAR